MAVYNSFAEAQDALDNSVWEQDVNGNDARVPDSEVRLPDGTRLANTGDRLPLSPARRKQFQELLDGRRAEVVDFEKAFIDSTEAELDTDAGSVASRTTEAADLITGKLPDLEVGGFSVEELDEILMSVERVAADHRVAQAAWSSRANRWDAGADTRKDVEAFAVNNAHDLFRRFPALRAHRPHPLSFPW